MLAIEFQGLRGFGVALEGSTRFITPLPIMCPCRFGVWSLGSGGHVLGLRVWERVAPRLDSRPLHHHRVPTGFVNY